MLDDPIKEIAGQRDGIKDQVVEIEERNADLNNLKAELNAKNKVTADEWVKLQSFNTMYKNKPNDLNILMKAVEPF